MKIKRDIIIYIIMAISICLVVYVFATNDFFEPDNNKEHVPIQQVQMIITAPNWTINYTSTNTTNTTVSDLLFEWSAASNITIEKEFFSGYDSYIISGINGTINGQNNSYWQFYVNGEFATLSSDSYYLHKDDIVEWRFEPSPW